MAEVQLRLSSLRRIFSILVIFSVVSIYNHLKHWLVQSVRPNCPGLCRSVELIQHMTFSHINNTITELAQKPILNKGIRWVHFLTSSWGYFPIHRVWETLCCNAQLSGGGDVLLQSSKQMVTILSFLSSTLFLLLLALLTVISVSQCQANLTKYVQPVNQCFIFSFRLIFAKIQFGLEIFLPILIIPFVW